jgi:hypothetical protein
VAWLRMAERGVAKNGGAWRGQECWSVAWLRVAERGVWAKSGGE